MKKIVPLILFFFFLMTQAFAMTKSEKIELIESIQAKSIETSEELTVLLDLKDQISAENEKISKAALSGGGAEVALYLTGGYTLIKLLNGLRSSGNKAINDLIKALLSSLGGAYATKVIISSQIKIQVSRENIKLLEQSVKIQEAKVRDELTEQEFYLQILNEIETN